MDNVTARSPGPLPRGSKVTRNNCSSRGSIPRGLRRDPQTTYARRFAVIRTCTTVVPRLRRRKRAQNIHGLPGLVLSECCKETNQSNTLHCPRPSLLVSRHFPIKEASCGNLPKKMRRSHDSSEHREKQQQRYSWPLSPRPSRLERY